MSIRQRNAHFTDWAAVCKALHVNTESEARAALESSDNTFYYYVCYIKSTKEIYTHGQIYSCSGNDDLLDLINELTTEVVENEEVTARALTELSENKASRGEVEMFELSKQDRIDDLDSIRTKANNAVQPDQISNFVSANDLAKVATTGNYNDLNNKPTIPAAQVNSDWNATSGKAQILNKPSLSKVATTGSYNDLLNKPTIPSAVTETTVSGWGFTKNTGTYSKPSTGIPVSDLENSVQTSLNKANSAIQSTDIEDVARLDDGYVLAEGFASNDGEEYWYLPNTLVDDSAHTLATKQDLGKLSTVARSGSYNDLIDKPTIPTEVTESTVSGWGFTKNTGTVKNVKINGIIKNPSNGTIDLGTVLTSYTPMTLNTADTSPSVLRWAPNQKYAYTAATSSGTVVFNMDLSNINVQKDNTWCLSFITGSTVPTINFNIGQSGYTIMWANGVAPIFEPNTFYEISFKLVGTYLLGVCGAFKAV